ncbi:hypothetical protein ACFVUS_20155 [Nocardia sp. NPDC058058]|uniref:hypothetical protein n=1 Tax=Nocardia sp. NPDC058058 TaxID=3346317 RepID=UPI0036DC6B8B
MVELDRIERPRIAGRGGADDRDPGTDQAREGQGRERVTATTRQQRHDLLTPDKATMLLEARSPATLRGRLPTVNWNGFEYYELPTVAGFYPRRGELRR